MERLQKITSLNLTVVQRVVRRVVWAGANLEISNTPRINLGRLSMRKVRTTVKRILVIWTSLPWAIVNPKERNLQ